MLDIDCKQFDRSEREREHDLTACVFEVSDIALAQCALVADAFERGECDRVVGDKFEHLPCGSVFGHRFELVRLDQHRLVELFCLQDRLAGADLARQKLRLQLFECVVQAMRAFEIRGVFVGKFGRSDGQFVNYGVGRRGGVFGVFAVVVQVGDAIVFAVGALTYYLCLLLPDGGIWWFMARAGICCCLCSMIILWI